MPHHCPTFNCGRQFKRASDLKRHQHIHSQAREDSKLKCFMPNCEYKTLQKRHLDSHIASIHHHNRPFICSEDAKCTFSSASQGALTRHLKERHGLTSPAPNNKRPQGCATMQWVDPFAPPGGPSTVPTYIQSNYPPPGRGPSIFFPTAQPNTHDLHAHWDPMYQAMELNPGPSLLERSAGWARNASVTSEEGLCPEWMKHQRV